MTHIVSPKEQIIIEIDGLTGQASLKLTRELPYPFLVQVFCALLEKLSAEQLRKLSGPTPVELQPKTPLNPFENPTNGS